MNNEHLPGDNGRVYITEKHTAKRTEVPPEARPRHELPRVHDKTLSIVLLCTFVLFGAVLLTFITVLSLSAGGTYSSGEDDPTPPRGVNAVLPAVTSEEVVTEPTTEMTTEAQTDAPATEAAPAIETIYGINSGYAVLMDAESGYVLAAKNADAVMYPASLTKIMTLIVARERISELSDSVTFTKKMLYSLELDAMKVGFSIGESVSAIDLMYGTMLPSGCDAALGLAYLCSGSEEAFAEEMNRKVAELGLGRTHFTNSTGLHDSENYSTAQDMARIFAYALSDELMRQIICADSYSVVGYLDGAAQKHRVIDRMRKNIDDYAVAYGSVKLEGFTMLGGKTGYIDESGSCLASYAVSDSGRHYIIVTADARNMHEVLSDHYGILMKYAK